MQDPSEKRLAKPTEELTADLFRLFERQAHWSFSQLQRHTDQPTQHLKAGRGGMAAGMADRAVHAAAPVCGKCNQSKCWSVCGQGGTGCGAWTEPRPGKPTPPAPLLFRAGGAHGDCGAEQARSIQGPLGAQKGLPIVRRRRSMRLVAGIVCRACCRVSAGCRHQRHEGAVPRCFRLN